MRHNLIDEFRFWIRPVVVGAGQRLFEDVDTSNLRLKLTDMKSLANGSVILSYSPTADRLSASETEHRVATISSTAPIHEDGFAA